MGTYQPDTEEIVDAMKEIDELFNQQKYGEAWSLSFGLNKRGLRDYDHNIRLAAYWSQRAMIELHHFRFRGTFDDAFQSFRNARSCRDFNDSMERAFRRDLALATIRRIPKKPQRSVMEFAGSTKASTIVEDLLEPMRVCNDMNERACRQMILGRKEFERARKVYDREEQAKLLNKALRSLKAAAATWNLLLPESVNAQWKINHTYTLFKVVRLCEKLGYPEVSLEAVPSSEQLYDAVKASNPSAFKVRAARLIMFHPELGCMIEELGAKLR